MRPFVAAIWLVEVVGIVNPNLNLPGHESRQSRSDDGFNRHANGPLLGGNLVVLVKRVLRSQEPRISVQTLAMQQIPQVEDGRHERDRDDVRLAIVAIKGGSSEPELPRQTPRRRRVVDRADLRIADAVHLFAIAQEAEVEDSVLHEVEP